ncbi:MAG: hypothetical protein ACXVEF_11335 [Polyangiales bacterium]
MIAAYFVGWIALTAASLGALALIAIAEVTSASWMIPMRRPAEALAGVLPLCVVGFAPIAIFAARLFPWARDVSTLSPEIARALAHKRSYLAAFPFVVRSALYLLSWTAIAELLRRWSIAQDDASDTEAAHLASKRRTLSAIALPWILFTGTFAAFDWLMSLEPEWFSHAYGAIFLVSGGAAAVAIVAALSARTAARSSAVSPAQLHAIGNMLLAAVMLWAYLMFGQLLIQWLADIPREIVWYLRRTRGPWTTIVIATALLHFAIPFFFLLIRALKRTSALAPIAALVVVGHLLDCALFVLPAQPVAPGSLVLALVPLAIGAIVMRLRYLRAPAVPTRDPLYRASLAFEMPS